MEEERTFNGDIPDPDENFYKGAEKLKNLDKLKNLLKGADEIKEKVVQAVDTFQEAGEAFGKAGKTLLDLVNEVSEKIQGESNDTGKPEPIHDGTGSS